MFGFGSFGGHCRTSVSVLRREGDAAAQYGLGFRSVDLAAPVRHPITGENVPLEGWRRASTSTVEDVRRLAGRPRAFGMLSRCSRTSECDDLARVRLDLGAVRGPGIHQAAAFIE